jgi:hypothetical protein
MESQQLLPFEVLNYTNFPELRTQRNNIEALQTYAMRMNEAITDFESGKYDKIALSDSELQTNIDLCRTVCEALGNASNVSFDVLMTLRDIQTTMQNVMYLKTTYGDLYVGTPTVTEEEGV